MREAGWKHLAAAAIVAAVLFPPGGARAAAVDLDAVLDRAMATGYTPGLAIAVVQGDRIVWTAARGFADRESRRAVTPETRFYIASSTKALTGLAAAQLASRGLLDFEAPLSRALPGARLHAGVHPESIRVVDLLTHTHGIDPDGPVSARVAYTGDYDHAGLLRALALHGPAPGGRAFEYSNLGYDLVGILLDPKQKGGWKDVVAREVTRPLGMSATTANRSQVSDRLLAWPYRTTGDGFERIPLAKEDANMGAAGGHFSTAGDLARLLVAELNEGRVDGRERIPAAVIAATQWGRVAQSPGGGSPGESRHAWGLGWDRGLLEGDTLLSRHGSFPGYFSHVSFLPGRDVGVVVLTNGGMSGGALAGLVAHAVYDRLLERPDADARLGAALAALDERVGKLRQAIVADRDRRAARAQALPHPLSAYAGTYVNADRGTLKLRVRGGRLEASMGVAASAVEVFDAAKNQLRVELFGGGSVLEAVFAPGETQAREVRMREAIFARR